MVEENEPNFLPLGDIAKSILTTSRIPDVIKMAGIRDCGCKNRQKRLNDIGKSVSRILLDKN